MSKTVIATPWHNNKAIISLNDQTNIQGPFTLVNIDRNTGCQITVKRANIRSGFNFAMFAVDNFFAKLKPPRSFYNTSVYSCLLLHVHLKIQNPWNQTTAKGPDQENRKILTPQN